jgi:diadenosine tetraphosphate (Ap4A) HIT family hydrolase
MFALHSQLKADTFRVCSLALCEVLLMNNMEFPWLILVPRLDAIEVVDMTVPERAMLMEEIALASRALQQLCAPDKLNIGALGNKVEQLHVHVIARFKGDSAWPEPVWGKDGSPYSDAQPTIAALKQALMQ